MSNKHTISDLYQMQSLPLSAKIRMTEYRIRQWYEEYGGEVYVSFSGGKDSTVLLNIARNLYSDIEAVFVNTGLEYQSIRKFALSHENTREIRPQKTFREVLIDSGYPIVSKEVAKRVYEYRKYEETDRFNKTCAYKEFNGLREKPNGEKSSYNKERHKFLVKAPFKISHFCCLDMKETPCFLYEEKTGKKPIIATMANESRARMKSWLESGCNAFDSNRPSSQPMSFWTENDVLEYIYINNLRIAQAYGNVIADNQNCKFHTTGCQRTGCIFCLFGIRKDKDRIARLQIKEPKLADYVLRGGQFGADGYWQPSNNGLGYWFVIYAIGYITRGCPNKCPWCYVPRKEGNIKPYRRWTELVRYDTPDLILMDNNILASEYGIGQLKDMAGKGWRIDLNQGMDARLVTEEIADVLASLQWIKYIRFSCDTVSQVKHIDRVAELLAERGVKPYRLFVYLLVRKDLDEADYRVQQLKKYKGIYLYAQAERNEGLGIRPNKAQLEFTNRYIYGNLYRKETWKEYINKRPWVKRRLEGL